MKLKELKTLGLKKSGFDTMTCGKGCAVDFVITRIGEIECSNCGTKYGKLTPQVKIND